MASRQLVIKTGVVKRLVAELAAYEKEAQDRLADLDRINGSDADAADKRQAERIHADSARMIPDTTKRLQKAGEELRDLLTGHSADLADSKELKDAQDVLAKYDSLGSTASKGQQETLINGHNPSAGDY
ncbi:hypothetical protein EMMF5_006533 [Cystobasidiomycetes sp. EMM_F5]